MFESYLKSQTAGQPCPHLGGSPARQRIRTDYVSTVGRRRGQTQCKICAGKREAKT